MPLRRFRLFGSSKRRNLLPTKRCGQPSRRLLFETLEVRQLLATYAAEGVGGDGLSGSEDVRVESSTDTIFAAVEILGNAPLTGDFNADNNVNGGDLTIWQAGFGTPSGAEVGDGDADEDGDVDGSDFLLWQRNFGATPSNVDPLIRSPYLQNVTQTGVKVMWGSNEPTGKVFWGSTVGTYTNSADSVAFLDNSGVYVHTAAIAGLTVGEKVYYYVQDASNGNFGYNDATYYATAAPASNADFRMAVYSDNQGDPSYETQHSAVINAMSPHNPDIVLNSGDISDDGQVWEFNDYFFSNAAPLIQNTPIYTSIGNHDLRVKRSDRTTFENDVKNYRDLFDLPVNSDDGTEDYYAFDYGSVLVISLNTEQVRSGTGYTDTARSAAMKNWLDSTLAATTQPWKIVFFHKPVYLDFIYSEGWTQIFEDRGVQMVFFGHLHGYYANYRNGVTYVTSAGGGAPIGQAPWWAWPDERIGAFHDYNFTQIDVTQAGLAVEVYDEEDVLRHSFDLDVSGNLTNNVVLPPMEEVDDFESYSGNTDLQNEWWAGGKNGGSMQRYLDTGGASGSSNVLRAEFSFAAGSTNPYGYTGRTSLWDWEAYTGIRLWVKASQSGPAQDFQIRLLEGGGQDKWIYSVPISSLNANGGYLSAPLSDFVWYGEGTPGKGNYLKDWDRITGITVGAGLGGVAFTGGTSSITVDDITGYIGTGVSAGSALAGVTNFESSTSATSLRSTSDFTDPPPARGDNMSFVINAMEKHGGGRTPVANFIFPSIISSRQLDPSGHAGRSIDGDAAAGRTGTIGVGVRLDANIRKRKVDENSGGLHRFDAIKEVVWREYPTPFFRGDTLGVLAQDLVTQIM